MHRQQLDPPVAVCCCVAGRQGVNRLAKLGPPRRHDQELHNLGPDSLHASPTERRLSGSVPFDYQPIGIKQSEGSDRVVEQPPQTIAETRPTLRRFDNTHPTVIACAASAFRVSG